jgi:preprotein translocase subunit SecF
MTETKHSLWTRLYRGETAFDFVGRRRRWFIISGTVILIGLVSLFVRGLNFGIEFKGGTVWEVSSTATVTHVRDTIGQISPDMRQATIEILTDRQTGKHTVRVSAQATATKDKTKVNAVTAALAKMAGVDINQVALNDVGPTWGHDITQKAERALVIFLIVVVIYITFRFEGKMAIAALIALLHDILITIGIYSLSGFTVSPATVIAFLTILGYSLYDTIVVFDKIEENTKGLAASGRITYTETVNLSMNQVLMRSINTSIVAIMPILSILLIGAYFLGASALEDFGLALFIGLLTGAYSSIFIAAPALAVMKEREPRYQQIHQRLANRATMTGVLTPAAAASGELLGGGAGSGGGGGGGRGRSAGSGAFVSGGGGGGRTRRAAPVSSAGGSKVIVPSKAKSAPLAGDDEVAIDEGDDSAEIQPVAVHYEGKPKAGARPNGAGGSAGSDGAGSSAGVAGAGGPARPAAPKPRPGAANRGAGGGGGGGNANRPGPRPRKKGKRR